MKLRKKNAIEKGLNAKEITIKRMKTKFDIKIIWNRMLGNKIENKIQLEKG